ncbi:uncharacterized protein TNCV_1210441 [Trichonephila clavipes]|nr:uncharacterized protein TNCV_1210441 [Trichonephila clavipes]
MSLDHGSKLRGPSPKAPRVAEQCDVNIKSNQIPPNAMLVFDVKITVLEVLKPLSARSFTNSGLTIATRGLLATDHVILNHGQVTWTTPELAPPLLTTTPHQREDVSALDRFSVHRCPTRRVFSGTGIELVTRQATIRYLYHSATAATM